MEKDTFYVLDSYGLIYRAYFALINHPLTNKAGQNISAVNIFFRNLKALISKYKPAYLAAAFDPKGKTFRHQMYDAYKANRMKSPDDLLAQIPWIEEILNELNVTVVRVDNFEADDVIATIAKKCSEKGMQCRILSGDKDLLQLVTDDCKEMQPDKVSGGWQTVGAEEVLSTWGIRPDQMLDYLSLVGDAADNVPGVKGVGEKTALKLLNEYASLEEIYLHADEIKGALGQKIRDSREDAFLSKKLISLRNDLPLDFDLEKFSTANLNFSSAAERLNFYGAFAVAKSFATEEGASCGTEGETGNGLPASGESGVETGMAVKKENASLKKDGGGQESLFDEEELLPVKENSGDYKAVTVLDDLVALVDKILALPEKTFAFDTETTGLEAVGTSLVGFSLSFESGKAFYVPVILPGGIFAPAVIEKNQAIKQLERLFYNREMTAVMHNGKFDLEVMLSNGFEKMPECKIFDTMVAAWILNPDRNGKSPFSLEYLGQTKLGLRGIEFKDVVQKGQTFADVDLDKATPYAAEDADFTWQLGKIFKEELLKAPKLNKLFYEMEMPLLPLLTEMEMTGIHLDKKALADFSVELDEEIHQKEKEIFEVAGHEFNIASTKQLQAVLFTEQGLVAGKKTKTGYSTDTAVLEELCERTQNPLPQLILDYRSFAKLQSTYVETLPLLADKNDRIHTCFLQTGTATGRLSSREPNLQNIPVRDKNGRRIRSAFTALDGMVLISADYAQIELVVLSHLSGDENLSNAFRQGIDVHASTASLIYGVKAEDVTADQRRFAKTVNFGVMYGMSAFRLAKELNISRTQAKEFIDQYFKTYSGVKEFIDQTVASARETGFVETIMGRKREIKQILSRNKVEEQAGERVAINTPIQGSAADIVKTAMLKVKEELVRTQSKAKMLLQVHDELIFECPDDEKTVQETIALIKKTMESAVQLSVPLRVSIEYGKNWGEFH